MNYSFEYIDIILLAMIAGFIFLRLRGILGKRTGFEGKASPQFEKILKNVQTEKKIFKKEEFDDQAQKDFLKGAKIAYETIITDFSDSDNKLTTSKSLLSKKIFDQFNIALQERNKRGHFAEITFIGIDSANIKEHKFLGKILQVTVDHPLLNSKNFDSAISIMNIFESDEVLAVKKESDNFFHHNGKGLVPFKKSSNLILEREEVYRHISSLRLFTKKSLIEPVKNKKMHESTSGR